MKSLSFFYLFLFTSLCYGQNSDSTVIPTDSADAFETTDLKDATAPSDSLQIQARRFDETSLKRLKADEDLQYKEPPTIGESLFDRLVLWIRQFFDSLFRNAVETNWGNILSYVIGIVVLIALIMTFLKVNAFRIFYSGEGASTMAHHVFEENIHEMDFEKLIQEAIAERDYRKGIRLIFLHALKMLADKRFIQWEQGKTNHDYLSELNQQDLRTGFNELNYYFEYAWYGNFAVSHDMFLKVQDVFKEWQRQMR